MDGVRAAVQGLLAGAADQVEDPQAIADRLPVALAELVARCETAADSLTS